MKRKVSILEVTVLLFIVLALGFCLFNHNNPGLKEELLEKKEQLAVAVMANKLMKAETVENFEKIIKDNNRLIASLLEKNYLTDGDLNKLQQFLIQWKTVGNDFKQEKIHSLMTYLKNKLSEKDYRKIEQIFKQEKINLETVQQLYRVWQKNNQIENDESIKDGRK